MAAPRAQQVLQEKIALLPARYPAYHKDLIELLNDLLREIVDETDRASRRRKLAAAIKAKASQLPTAKNAP